MKQENFSLTVLAIFIALVLFVCARGETFGFGNSLYDIMRIK